ncbi:MAG: hypothetical protein QOJ97_521 [Solirubrobacteraceae bacterium]|jgi:hypothetical protein|nr:hypothetical protein [Solirubrobacteraceae bacterium]
MHGVHSKSTARRLVGLLGAAIAAVSLTTLWAPPPARANTGLLSFMMDDDLLVFSTYGTREFIMGYMHNAGVDGVRVTVPWKFVSGEEGGRPVRRPARLTGKRAEDPRSYRSDIWDRFDDIVRLARTHGMVVLFNITGPGPVWAHPRAPYSNRFDQASWRPSPGEFRHFVKAVGRRYSGTWRDENQDRGLLPKVHLWSIWNEVNQPASLSPQMGYEPRLRREIPIAPILYRDLYYAASAALAETGHADSALMMGETAPLGAIRDTPRVHLWPKQFIRELFCLRPNLRPYTGLEAKVRRCDVLRRNGPFRVTAWAHHPYTQRNPPTQRDVFRDSINMANIGELPVLLDQIAARTKLIPRGLPVALTEAGWETLPPDPVRGVSLANQAEYLNRAQRMAYDQPRVFMDTQFILRDVVPRAQYRGQRSRLAQYWATWQSGLLFADGSPKPALAAFLVPFDLRSSGGGSLRFWGQVRFVGPNVPQDVYLQFRPAGSSDWQLAAGPIPTQGAQNFWERSVPDPGPGVWRVALLFHGHPALSREISVTG